MKVNAHLREFHGCSLAESVRWPPDEMARIHEREHQDHDCGHQADDLRTKCPSR